MSAKRNITDGKTAEGMLRLWATPTSADETISPSVMTAVIKRNLGHYWINVVVNFRVSYSVIFWEYADDRVGNSKLQKLVVVLY